MRRWKRLKPKQFQWLKSVLHVWVGCLLVFSILYIVLEANSILFGTVAIAMLIMGVVCIATTTLKTGRIRKKSNLMEDFIRKNSLYQSHYVLKNGLFWSKEVEQIDYYPIIEYREIADKNVFCIRIRLDGSLITEKFRDLEQALSDMFCTVCTDVIEERGYLTYCFELRPQKQLKIQSEKDIPFAGECEIVFSNDIVWNWKTCCHFLLTGNTGSGKTKIAQYIIFCLVRQGVRVIYCDPKNDNEMWFFVNYQHNAVYASEEKEIAKAVRETEEEMLKRGKELDNIGIQEADFQPLYLIFDEMISYEKISDKKLYETTIRRIASIVVMGRSKRIFAGIITQRSDVEYVGGGAVRDNLGCRICMGQMSDTAYKMAFGTDFADVKNLRREIGSGLIYRQGVDTKPREFLAPYIEKGALD